MGGEVMGGEVMGGEVMGDLRHDRPFDQDARITTTAFGLGRSFMLGSVHE